MVSKHARSLKAAAKVTVFLVAGFAVTACAPMYRKHGYVPTEEQLAEVVVGVDTKDTVAETIGVPAAEGVLSDGGYYYVSTLMRRRGPSALKPVSRELVAGDLQPAGRGVGHRTLRSGAGQGDSAAAPRDQLQHSGQNLPASASGQPWQLWPRWSGRINRPATPRHLPDMRSVLAAEDPAARATA